MADACTCRSPSTASSPGRIKAATTRSASGSGGSRLAPWRRARERGGRHCRAASVAPPRRLRHGPQHVGPIRGEWDGSGRAGGGPEPPYRAPCSSSPITLTRQSRWRAGRRQLRHRWLRRRLRQPRGCRRRRHRHRGRRLDRPPSRCRRASSTALRLNIVPVLLQYSEGCQRRRRVEPRPSRSLHSPLATHICYRRAG